MAKNSNIEDILNNFRSGSETAFNEIFLMLYPPLCYYGFRITGDDAVSKDIAGESFIKVWKRRKDFDSFRGLKSFLYKTVRNACFDWLRKNKTQLSALDDLSAPGEQRETSRLEHMIMSETYRELHAAIEKLPAQCRQVISLSYLEEKSSKQIAVALNIDPITVRTQRHRGIMLLRKRLKYFLPFLL